MCPFSYSVVDHIQSLGVNHKQGLNLDHSVGAR